METEIERQVMDREQQFIKSVETILTQSHADRIKIKLIYEEYVNCHVDVNIMISKSISKK